jgi:hypothetical protein
MPRLAAAPTRVGSSALSRFGLPHVGPWSLAAACNVLLEEAATAGVRDEAWLSHPTQFGWPMSGP